MKLTLQRNILYLGGDHSLKQLINTSDENKKRRISN